MSKCSNSDCNTELNEKVLEYSTKNFGTPLCFNCQKVAVKKSNDSIGNNARGSDRKQTRYMNESDKQELTTRRMSIMTAKDIVLAHNFELDRELNNDGEMTLSAKVDKIFSVAGMIYAKVNGEWKK